MMTGICSGAKETLDRQIEEGVCVTDAEENHYLYELTMDGCSQTGVPAMTIM